MVLNATERILFLPTKLHVMIYWEVFVNKICKSKPSLSKYEFLKIFLKMASSFMKCHWRSSNSQEVNLVFKFPHEIEITALNIKTMSYPPLLHFLNEELYMLDNTNCPEFLEGLMFANSCWSIYWEKCQPLGEMYPIEQLVSGSAPALTPFPPSGWQAKCSFFPTEGYPRSQGKGTVPFWLRFLWGRLVSFKPPSPTSSCSAIDERTGTVVINTSAHLLLLYSHSGYFLDGRRPHI